MDYKKIINFGFEIKLPPDWEVIETSSFVKVFPPSSKNQIETRDGMDNYIEFLIGDGLCSETNIWNVGYGSLSTKSFKSFCPVNSNVNRVFMSASADNLKRTEELIIDTLSNLPVINSIYPTSGPIGTMVTIIGSNLNGFEGDMDAMIENSKGETAFLLGLDGIPSVFQANNQIIRVKIEDKICRKGNTYTGLPCESYLNITPGVYNIYAYPWGKMSNKVKFTVTE